jgi:hydroxyacylglutathione hydrolase
MVSVIRNINFPYTSNTYLITIGNSPQVWLVDAGFTKGVEDIIPSEMELMGVFLTHPHYDHIHGLNTIKKAYPNAQIYCSEQTMKGLYSDKLNLSFYHEQPIVYEGSNIKVLKEGDVVELNSNHFIKIVETPGHHLGAITFALDNYLFSGDSFIPGVPVVTKLKGGDKSQNNNTLQRIKNLISNDTVICPGHQDMLLGSEINLSHFPDLCN